MNPQCALCGQNSLLTRVIYHGVSSNGPFSFLLCEECHCDVKAANGFPRRLNALNDIVVQRLIERGDIDKYGNVLQQDEE